MSNLSCSAKMHSGFYIWSGFQVDSALLMKYRYCCANYSEGLFYIYLSVDSILIWYLKREYPNTQLSEIKAVSVLKWGSRNWCENPTFRLSAAFSAQYSSDSGGRMSDIQHWTELRDLINGPLVDRQFPPLQGVEQRSWGAGAECKRSSSAQSLDWPHSSAAGRQPAASAPRLAHNWANRAHNFLFRENIKYLKFIEALF